ncbi:prolyl oligopeptidase family serine peptidase [Sphingobacterium sp. DK4209]|uniref:Prolyl oligopeptidase family serine peptidase n=1 Tax=Sphingobacterium zhuxiongii TaxID=2662364 RepID=A0A5Q0QAR7_9SPHI|nr:MULTISPECIES: prolyl oligopeptidase family serine peptidase [unclassified Sphingobacterium]MVZ66826.1 prolyl oligopeptidase family serine peptidase [Sphingobacterium sp. DK4209]QGA26249.1 prolyl oligopeptidase family serine peptidase [Sphingobacterium sp. dk4302]
MTKPIFQRTCYLIAFIILCFSQNTKAQLKAYNEKYGYSYWVRMPKVESTKEKIPVIIFLHGRSLSGHDLARVKRYGVLRAIERGKDLEAIIVAPQTSNGWDPDKVMEVLDKVEQEYPVDKERVYVCGMSMGGYGTMDVAGKYPDRIAAAVAICGGGTLSYACNLTQVPLWIQHGSADRAVPASESKKIYNAIKKCDKDADATLTIIPGGTHGSVERLFHGEKIYDFMFRHVKES